MVKRIETISHIAKMAAKRRLTYVGNSPKPQPSDHMYTSSTTASHVQHSTSWRPIVGKRRVSVTTRGGTQQSASDSHLLSSAAITILMISRSHPPHPSLLLFGCAIRFGWIHGTPQAWIAASVPVTSDASAASVRAPQPISIFAPAFPPSAISQSIYTGRPIPHYQSISDLISSAVFAYEPYTDTSNAGWQESKKVQAGIFLISYFVTHLKILPMSVLFDR